MASRQDLRHLRHPNYPRWYPIQHVMDRDWKPRTSIFYVILSAEVSRSFCSGETAVGECSSYEGLREIVRNSMAPFWLLWDIPDYRSYYRHGRGPGQGTGRFGSAHGIQRLHVHKIPCAMIHIRPFPWGIASPNPVLLRPTDLQQRETDVPHADISIEVIEWLEINIGHHIIQQSLRCFISISEIYQLAHSRDWIILTVARSSHSNWFDLSMRPGSHQRETGGRWSLHRSYY